MPKETVTGLKSYSSPECTICNKLTPEGNRQHIKDYSSETEGEYNSDSHSGDSDSDDNHDSLSDTSDHNPTEKQATTKVQDIPIEVVTHSVIVPSRVPRYANYHPTSQRSSDRHDGQSSSDRHVSQRSWDRHDIQLQPFYDRLALQEHKDATKRLNGDIQKSQIQFPESHASNSNTPSNKNEHGQWRRHRQANTNANNHPSNCSNRRSKEDKVAPSVNNNWNQKNKSDEAGDYLKPPRRLKKVSHILMPTGKKYFITNTAIPDWNCTNKTRFITLRPNGKMGRREYNIVVKEMEHTMVDLPFCETSGGCFTKYEIIKVQKIVQGCAWRRYRARQRDIREERGDVNERMLFHGSPNASVVAAGGFDERFAGEGGKLGAGIYFTDRSSIANQFAFGFFGGQGCPEHKDKNCYICERQMLLCRVSLGTVNKLYQSSMGQLSHPPPEHHSVSGEPGEGSFDYPEYVVYRGEQAYPEYLITYRIVK